MSLRSSQVASSRSDEEEPSNEDHMNHVDEHETTPLLGKTNGETDQTLRPEIHYKNVDGKRFRTLFGCILLSYFLVYFDYAFLSSSHPVITSYFHASNAASWLSTVFSLTTAISAPLYGRLSDVTGRKSMYVFALVIFALTTMWCGVSRSIGELIAARAFCGVGAGGVAVMSNIILSDIVKIQYRGIYQSYLNLVFGFAHGAGASLGGLLADKLGWRATFYLQVPLILLLTVLAVIATPKYLGPSLAKTEKKSVTQTLSSFDFAGAALLTLTIAGLILGINLGGNVLPWTHPVVIVALVTFPLAAIGLVLAEKRAIRPLLPLELLSTIPFGNLNWSNVLGSMLNSIVNFNIPLFLQAVKQVSATKSGLLLLSPLTSICIVSVCVGFAISKTRRLKPFMNAGALSMLGGMLACALLDEHTSITAIIFLIPWVSVGQGFLFPTSTISNLAMSSAKEQAVVVTTLTISRTLGLIIGIAVSSWILQNALIVFLQQEVSGTSHVKDDIIRSVRKSIKAIADLDTLHREEGQCHNEILTQD